MAHRKKHKQTGPTHHKDMVHRLPGLGGKDPHASGEFHKGNREAGMHEGMSPTEENCDEGGGEGMAGNCEYE